MGLADRHPEPAADVFDDLAAVAAEGAAGKRRGGGRLAHRPFDAGGWDRLGVAIAQS